MFHILYDGSVTDEDGFVAMGGEAEALAERLKGGYRRGMSLADALKLGVDALTTQNGDRLDAARVEAAVLDRTRRRRKFLRLPEDEVAGLLRS
jgi:proteasome alpha subunit